MPFGTVRALLCAAVIFCAAPTVAQDADKTANIGVLAFRGSEAAQTRWQELADYLGQAVPGWNFRIVPVTLVSAPEKLDRQQIDFLITNPGHYVSLEQDYPLSPLATLERHVEGSQAGLLTYGTAIIARADSEIRTIDDLKGKRLGAVSPDAFGGFQIAWAEMIRHNFDPFRDLASIRFMGFPQDAIVAAVETGEMDAGVVRSGLLESLAAEEKVSMSDFVVLHGGAHVDYPHLISGRLYPEWPFLALSATEKKLRERVALALLHTQDREVRTKFTLRDVWSTPLSYAAARNLVAAYQERMPSRLRPREAADNGIVFAFLLGALVAALATWFALRTVGAIGPSARVATSSAEPPDTSLEEARARFEALTRRERQVLVQICKGRTNKEIADTLGISPKTVEFHRANLLQKTEAGSTANLVQLSTRLGLDNSAYLGNSSQ